MPIAPVIPVLRAIFDLTHSSVSHSVRARMAKDHKFRDYFEKLNSQFKV